MTGIVAVLQRLEVDEALADGQERREAINPFDSYIVQAPAGSGKTALLTQRFLALLCTVQSPEQVVAMTFTKKAAAEMRSRILQTLQKGQHPLPDNASLYDRNTHRLATAALQQSEAMGWHLLQNPSRLRIRTLDSMNGYLVQQMPYLSRFGAQAKVSEQPTELYRQAAVQALQDEETQQASGTLLKLVNGRFSQAVDLIVSMLQKRDQWLPVVHLQQEREALESAIEAIVQQEMAERQLILQEARPILRQIVSMAEYAIEHDPKQPLDTVCGFDLSFSVEALPRWRALANWILKKDGDLKGARLTKAEGFPTVKDGGSAEKKQQMKTLLEELGTLPGVADALGQLQKLPDPLYTDEQWQDLQQLMALMQRAAAYLKVVFDQVGESDFIEVAMAANQALGTEDAPTDLALQLDYRIQHLLIDEFQDTSVTQSELLQKLVAGWQPEDGRTLFIVGDPMQSIYRFREAEVGNFLQAWGMDGQPAALGEVALKPLRLQVNFRSTQGVIDWVNRTFKPLFPQYNNIAKGAVCYTPAVPFSDDVAHAVTTHWALNQSDMDHYQQMVKVIQQRLPQLEGTGEKIAVLGRSRSHLVALAGQLKQAGLGFRAVELEQLSQRQEVQDIQALTRALLHLGDRDAWLALLRSPLVGLNLPDLTVLAGVEPRLQKAFSLWQILQKLFQYWQEGSENQKEIAEKSQNPQSCLLGLVQEMANQLSEAGCLRLQAVVPVLQAALVQWHSEHPVALVKAAWLALLGAQTLPEEMALEGLENIEAYLQMLGQIPASELRFDTIESHLQSLFALPDTRETAGKIELMTMHKSKGLEFDTVLLPSLGKKGRNNEEQILNWLQFRQDQQVYWLIAPLTKKAGKGRSVLSELVKQYDKEKQQYENIRLLYVAATRAKRQLHLFGEVSYSESSYEKERPITPQAGSLLELMWPVVRVEFSGLLKSLDFKQADQEQAVEIRLPRLPLSALTQVGFLKPIHRPSQKSVPTASELPEGTESMTWSLADEMGRLVGVLLHQQLEQWVRQGFTPDQQEAFLQNLPSHRALYQHWLMQQGLDASEAELGCERVLQGLENALNHPQLCWALDSTHQDSAVELVLHEVVEAQLGSASVVQHIVDRTFIDTEGVRWIVDYKTSRFNRAADELEDWLAEKVAHYQPQLARYGALFAQQEQRTQRWVLYFSDVNRWVEVPQS